jgi:16S rRNA (cytidine1402-2'-O)-methyltransferase
VVATPIGNLGDLSPRAQTTLSLADRIVAEDTRHTRKLLAHFEIHVPLVSCHAHNEAGKVPFLIDCLLQGEHLALVTDAGTPLVSDPGQRLVEAAHRAGIPVSPVPGPVAAIAALSVAGFPGSRFHFEGFLPPRGARRRERLERLASRPEILIFYEAPNRLGPLLEDLGQTLGRARPALLARELTKLHETLIRAALGELGDRLAHLDEPLRGEAVLVVAGSEGEEVTGRAVAPTREQTLQVLLELLPPAQAAARVAALYGLSRKEVYHLALALRAVERG